MSDTQAAKARIRFRCPTTYTILLVLIVVAAGLTWIVPAGLYDRTDPDIHNHSLPIPGTYRSVEPEPQGILDVILAPVGGFYKPLGYEAQAIDIALYILVMGGYLGVIARTGAITAVIERAINRLEGREKWMIPILMALFAAAGSLFGFAEESFAFYMLIVPVMIAAGYDALTGVAVLLVGAGIGNLGSTVNPFSTLIASDIAEVPLTDGLALRLAILIACWAVASVYVMRYAERVRRDPERSLVANRREANIAFFVGEKPDDAEVIEFTPTRRAVLVVFALSFAVLIWGVSVGGWWMAELTGLFLVAAIVVGVVARLGEEEFVSTFVDGAKDVLPVALIVCLARAVLVVLDNGHVTDTLLFWAEEGIFGLPHIVFINVVFGFELIFANLIPSSSGLAVLTMPILVDLADVSEVNRSLVVTAFQSASGMVELFTPTSVVLMGGLAIGRVPYDRWLLFAAPLLAILIIIVCAGLSLGLL
ncbi:MAG: YfcC family protein, partial [Alphaproteobacteria bacterium]|nr:YfcC family protein [Alphaproteobacteria bacterium]